LIVQSNHKNTFRTNHDSISSKSRVKQWGVTLYMGIPGGQINKIWPKMSPNIGNRQINSPIEPFGNAKLLLNTFRTKHDGISSK